MELQKLRPMWQKLINLVEGKHEKLLERHYELIVQKLEDVGLIDLK